MYLINVQNLISVQGLHDPKIMLSFTETVQNCPNPLQNAKKILVKMDYFRQIFQIFANFDLQIHKSECTFIR